MLDKGNRRPNRILVIGGGFSGITTAIEAAETGAEVVIVEKNPYLGGRVAQLNKYFPKMCPPICGLDLNFRRIKSNPYIKFYTMSQVESITGSEGNYNVTIKLNPMYINNKCTACGECANICPAKRPNDFNLGMDETKAAYIPFSQAFPQQYVIDKKYCQDGCQDCVNVCKYGVIDIDRKPKQVEIQVGSIVVATGWNPYDATKIDNLNIGGVKNVITNMMMERLASQVCHTQGKILRPSDKKQVQSVAFVQCAGSRDENYLPFCSYICCMASLKHTIYLKEQNPETRSYIFYIDIRTPGKYEKFYNQVKADPNVSFIKGKVAKIIQDKNSDDVIVVAEDILKGQKIDVKVDMVVLATGMEPSGASNKIPGINYIEGFAVSCNGIYATGCSKNPMDVTRSAQDATSAALKAIQSCRGR